MRASTLPTRHMNRRLERRQAGRRCHVNRLSHRMAAVYPSAMNPVSYRCHRFPPQIIQHAIWLYCRFTLSFRDVEDILAERGLDVSY